MSKEIGPKELERRRQREAQADTGALPHEKPVGLLTPSIIRAETTKLREECAAIAETAKPKRDRAAYQRDLMRKRRAEAKAQKP